VIGLGGDATTGSMAPGGDGLEGAGGSANNGDGGSGVTASGGAGSLPGHLGGDGITAFSGGGDSGATAGFAGSFHGDIQITGALMVTSGMKMFHIDHPLDPGNRYLNHAAIESSELLDLYTGNVTTDMNGDAVVKLPDWFEALNRDFRYQLTVLGTFAQAIVATKISGNRFAIKTNAPNVEVSWQVTGVRSDPTTQKFALKVEEDKPARERGLYLNPDVYGQPEEKGVEWARHPELMQRLKEKTDRRKSSAAQGNAGKNKEARSARKSGGSR
jgi:hypothetical protein